MGAPQYFEKDGEIGGAVYVYINKGGKWNQVKPTRINGPKNSMFGLAVENLGDINQDGYQGMTSWWIFQVTGGVPVSHFWTAFAVLCFKSVMETQVIVISFFCLHIAIL